ncbi:MAG: ribosome biogenesis GTPase YqeH [Alicyclobacillus herbarius]|uniref:ribosome biogenesis GTPase YqeH n=1 Tax=Alicyclobacillus herbarius TaxID=122960 RepID=UPI00235325BE|nr:ribosome biogenesis GTPase YqeH [Alicyclobacillus herbarius]MCL6631054.1 ribosome biogenesis GTPase YqeH [Alicyclobacillus herbarius]
MSETLVCSGCGVALQTEREDEPGYVPVSALTRIDPVCRRCYRITHYGEFSPIVVPVEEYERQVAEVGKHPDLVLYVLDVFDLEGSLVPGLRSLIGKSKTLVVVNKVDLLPREVRVDALTDWVSHVVRGTGIEPAGVCFVSARHGRGLEQVAAQIETMAEARAYVVGMANVGKSTLLNRLLAEGKSDGLNFTVSRVPGTTLGLVGTEYETPSGRTVQLFDTPGLIRGRRAIDLLCADCLKVAVPEQRLRPRIYQLNPGQSLWIGNFARFDLVEGEYQPIVCYVSNRLTVHRTKLERAEAFGKNHADDILRVPCPACRARLGELRRVAIEGPVRQMPQAGAAQIHFGRKGADITLAGIGWLSLFGRRMRGNLWLSNPLAYAVRPRLLGDLSRR